MWWCAFGLHLLWTVLLLKGIGRGAPTATRPTLLYTTRLFVLISVTVDSLIVYNIEHGMDLFEDYFGEMQIISFSFCVTQLTLQLHFELLRSAKSQSSTSKCDGCGHNRTLPHLECPACKGRREAKVRSVDVISKSGNMSLGLSPSVVVPAAEPS